MYHTNDDSKHLNCILTNYQEMAFKRIVCLKDFRAKLFSWGPVRFSRCICAESQENIDP